MLILSQMQFKICIEIDLKYLSLYACLAIAGRRLFLLLVLYEGTEQFLQNMF